MKLWRCIVGIIFVVAANQIFGAVRQTVPAAGPVEVIVQNSDGEPIEGVNVALEGYPYSTSSKLEIIAKTDIFGRATFQVLPAGCYKMRAARNGYFAVNSVGDREDAATTEISIGMPPWPLVNPCESKSVNPAIKLTLVPQAIIAGKIHNTNGSPLSGASVTLMKILYSYGQKFLYAMRSVETDIRGAYRVSVLAAGEYYIRVNNTPGADRNENITYVVRTYYPGANDMRDAVPVVVTEGQEITNIDFDLKPAPKGVTVSGKAFIRESGGTPDPIGRTQSPVQIILISTQEGLAESVALNGTGPGENDGTEFPFEIRNVPPGEYSLYAAFSDRTQKDSDSLIQIRSFAGQRKIRVEDKDMAGINVTIGNGAEIHGQFRFHGVDTLEPDTIHTHSGPNAVAFQSLAQNLPHFASLRQGFPGYVKDDTFTIPNLMEGRYQLVSIAEVAGIYGDSYLEDIRQNGRSIYRDGIVTVETSRVELELVVNRNGGKIRGKIDMQGKDLPITGSVVLVPDAPYRANLALYKYGRFDETGMFSFAGVAPGNYNIFAFDKLERGAEQNAEFIARYEKRGTLVTSSAGVETEVLRVPLIRSRSTD